MKESTKETRKRNLPVQAPTGADQVPFTEQDLLGGVTAEYPGWQVPRTCVDNERVVGQKANGVTVSFKGEQRIPKKEGRKKKRR